MRASEHPGIRRPFADRAEAGRLLGEALAERLRPTRSDPSTGSPTSPGVVVLGIPRGGVVVAAGVAGALGAPLDVIVARKIGAPYQPELAIGAATADGTTVIEPWAREVGADERYVERATAEAVDAARRREATIRGGRAGVPLAGRLALVVDDGIATGATMTVAVLAVRAAGAARVVVAAPVGSRLSLERLREIADDVVLLAVPEPFDAVGEFYVRFDQTSEAEVERLLGGRAATS